MNKCHAILLAIALSSCGKSDDKRAVSAPPPSKVSVDSLAVETPRRFIDASLGETCAALDEFFLTFTKTYLQGLSLDMSCSEAKEDFFSNEELSLVPKAEPFTCAADRSCFKAILTFSNEEGTDRYYVMIARIKGGRNQSVVFSDKRNKHFLPLSDEVREGELLHDNLARLRKSLETWLAR